MSHTIKFTLVKCTIQWFSVQFTLNNTGLSCAGPLICEFFSVNTCTVFDLQLEVRGCRGPNVSMPFYTGDLSVLRFWYPQWS